MLVFGSFIHSRDHYNIFLINRMHCYHYLTAYIKRVIVHPSFHNITFKQAEKLLVDMDQGEAIIRPSSKVRSIVMLLLGLVARDKLNTVYVTLQFKTTLEPENLRLSHGLVSP